MMNIDSQLLLHDDGDDDDGVRHLGGRGGESVQSPNPLLRGKLLGPESWSWSRGGENKNKNKKNM